MTKAGREIGAWAVDKLLVPVVTALLVVGGAWVTLRDVKADAAKVQDVHAGATGHVMLDARINILEESDEIQGKNIIAICHATDAACEF